LAYIGNLANGLVGCIILGVMQKVYKY